MADLSRLTPEKKARSLVDPESFAHHWRGMLASMKSSAGVMNMVVSYEKHLKPIHGPLPSALHFAAIYRSLDLLREGRP